MALVGHDGVVAALHVLTVVVVWCPLAGLEQVVLVYV